MPFGDGESEETTPPTLHTWATEVVECLRLSYAREVGRTGEREHGGDAVCLIEHRHGSGRRRTLGRTRGSRSPRRSGGRHHASSSVHGPSTRAQRVAERTARVDTRDRGDMCDREREDLRRDTDYVLVQVEEPHHGGFEHAEGPVIGATSSGSGGPMRPTTAVEPYRGHPGRGREAARDRPMTLQQGIDLWRHLLFSRSTMGPELVGNSRVPESFLPRSLLRDISERHEAMTLEERGVSTLALLTVIRFLAAELSHLIQQADGFDRMRHGSRRLNGEPETDDELLLQLTVFKKWKEPCGQLRDETEGDTRIYEDEVVFMQSFFRTEGHDSMQQRWARNMLRLQKELMVQTKERRRANVATLQVAMSASGDPAMGSPWAEQLQAVLVAVQADTVKHGDWRSWKKKNGSFITSSSARRRGLIWHPRQRHIKPGRIPRFANALRRRWIMGVPKDVVCSRLRPPRAREIDPDFAMSSLWKCQTMDPQFPWLSGRRWSRTPRMLPLSWYQALAPMSWQKLGNKTTKAEAPGSQWSQFSYVAMVGRRAWKHNEGRFRISFHTWSSLSMSRCTTDGEMGS